MAKLGASSDDGLVLHDSPHVGLFGLLRSDTANTFLPSEVISFILASSSSVCFCSLFSRQLCNQKKTILTVLSK
jgi:hypothetical protein